MAVRRSWLRTRQSLCLFLPCRRLPDRIREALYRHEMKMSEFSRSCSVSCGTCMLLVYCGSGAESLSPYINILHHFRAVSRWRFFHVDSSKEVLGREREDQVLQQCESYLTQMRKGSNDAHQVTPRESEILDLLRLGIQ